jgi:protoporphyrin/coproporphyrin ferrochelatase
MSSATAQQERTDSTERTAILLLQMGGPRTLDEVPEYIRTLFSDADLVRLPPPISWFRKPLAKFVARKRSPKVQDQYRQIGGGSPNNRITIEQAARLERVLNFGVEERRLDVRCYAAMTYTPPSTADALRQALADGCTRFLALSLFPHYSSASTGASISDLQRACTEVGVAFQDVQIIDTWAEDDAYLNSMAQRVGQSLRQATEAAANGEASTQPHLVISAHGVPESYVRRGDPYVDQVRASVQALMNRLPQSQPYTLCFQSRATPFKWVGPATDATMEALATNGERNLVVLPISFVNDHIETLFEIDIELAHIAKQAGAERVDRVPAFNADDDLMQVLAGLVRAKVAELHRSAS